ncbi:hypothetical protein ScPMuIL_009705 [Solemya velum]
MTYTWYTGVQWQPLNGHPLLVLHVTCRPTPRQGLFLGHGHIYQTTRKHSGKVAGVTVIRMWAATCKFHSRHHLQNSWKRILQIQGFFCQPRIEQISGCQSKRFFHGQPRRLLSQDIPPITMAVREDILNIFNSAIESVLPRQMVERVVSLSEDGCSLTVNNEKFLLKKNVYVVGFGKAVSGMARAIDDLLHDHIIKGIISIPVGSSEHLTMKGKSDLLVGENSKIEVHEGAEQNLPDEAAVRASLAIRDLVSDLTEEDVLIVLISGGGSALLTAPCPPITLRDMITVTRMLSTAGATIFELNTIRKNLELLKGGKLLEMALPAKVISLVLSDVVGDQLDMIASGPTQPNFSSAEECLKIIEKYDLGNKVPTSIIEFIQKKVESGVRPAVPSDTWPGTTSIIGSNDFATTIACSKAAELGYFPFLMGNSLEGEANTVGQMFGKLAKFISLSFTSQPNNSRVKALQAELIGKFDVPKSTLSSISSLISKAFSAGHGICLVSGGETVVNVKGTGTGGRAQQMVLSTAVQLNEFSFTNCHVEFLSGATDGMDGSSDAAGAVVNPDFIKQAQLMGLDPELYLNNNDSSNLFKAVDKGSSLVVTGLTGTNVMDIQIMIVTSV